MKKILFSAIAIIIAITAAAQERTMKIYRLGEVTHSISITDIDSIKIETKSIVTNNFINGHEYVDLGLPSGLKWATCNVGANNPEDYGDYYAWGETKTKSTYIESNSTTYGKYMSNISGNSKYDAARANWGSSWRIPTDDELTELRSKCTWKWTIQNGVSGYIVIGTNGNSIFLPAAGYQRGIQPNFVDSYGYYWSSTPDTEDGYYSYNIYFTASKYSRNLGFRFLGYSIRPVSK